MTPFTELTAPAIPLPLANVDTDQLIPARFMTRPRSAGYGGVLLHDMRAAADGPARAFDAPERRGAGIVVAQRNFGCGSSREAAVYALVDFGIRCVIAPSFGDIFASNAVNNGLLPAQLGEAEVEALLAALDLGLVDLSVDLQAMEIRAGAHHFTYVVDPVWRQKLLNGWDDLDLTLAHAVEIAAFAEADARCRPWATPASP